MILRVLLILFATTVLSYPAAAETPTAKRTRTEWARADKCNRDAIARYPDHDKESLANRERAYKICTQQLGGTPPPPLPLRR